MLIIVKICINISLLLSYINTKLRDEYSNIEKLVEDLNVSKEEIDEILNKIGYFYDQDNNRYF